MTQTQSVQEHLTAIRDELKAAGKKADAEARSRINTVLQHAHTAAAQIKAQSTGRNEEVVHYLDEITANAKKALEESGNTLHERIETMVAHAKSAVESAKKS